MVVKRTRALIKESPYRAMTLKHANIVPSKVAVSECWAEIYAINSLRRLSFRPTE